MFRPFREIIRMRQVVNKGSEARDHLVCFFHSGSFVGLCIGNYLQANERTFLVRILPRQSCLSDPF